MPSTATSEADLRGGRASLLRSPSLGLLNAGLWLFCLGLVLVPLGTVVLHGAVSGRLPELAQPDVARAAWNSFASATGSGILAVLIAAALVLLIEHTSLPGRAALRILALSPMLIPPFIGAISWTGLFGPSGLINSVAQDLLGSPLWIIYGGDGVIVLLALHSYPIAYLLIAAALARIPAELEEAARASGADSRRALRDVTLPLLKPALVSSFILVAVSNLGDFGIPALVGGPERYETLATIAYRFVRSGTVENPVELAACVGGVLLAMTALGMLLMRRFSRGSYPMETSYSAAELVRLRRPLLLGGLTWSFVMGITVLPLSALLLQSLMPAPGVDLTWENLSLQHFGTVLQSRWTTEGTQLSLGLAAGAALITGTVGLAIGTVITRTSLPCRSALRTTALLPLAVPGLIVAVGWLLLAPHLGLYNSPWLILCAYVMSFLALVVQAIEAPLRSTSATLEEAARISGANPVRAFSDVSVRLAIPAAAAGALLVFLTAMRELTISALLLAPNAQTLGVAIFNLQQAGSYGPAAALSVLVTVVGLVGMGLITSRLRSR
ncbi:ABC transporter permease [Nesterenkonia xinjiangensis]|uniref:Iron(III) transport system permease protein n=1 Tax=Nesterenkonia xinjiangensis TaxID=225327 RepID=A0A7Z0GQE2_9MICC|nr:iron ABC transporter permease [Nesterenkonia xinjiangensis]NYJ79381.1 iron(III) transport system permease protein [Nesterenkonia xinjiangensis]